MRRPRGRRHHPGGPRHDAVGLAAAPAPATTGDKAVLGKAIRDYLMANPEVLVEAMQELERKQDSQRDTVAQKAIQENRSALMSDPESPIVGNPNGDVTIVEFSDYQCPYCKRAHTAVKSVLAADSKVKLVFKDLPILGEPSRIAAFAALAARAQNKHLAFHDALMESNGKLDRAASWRSPARSASTSPSSKRTWTIPSSRRSSSATWRLPRRSACAAHRPS
jgi:protein-disulfide isomerase